MRSKINDQVAVAKDGDFFRRPGFSLRSPEACKQLRRAKWLGDVIVRTGIERGYFFLHIIAHRQHNDGHFAPFPQAF